MHEVEAGVAPGRAADVVLVHEHFAAVVPGKFDHLFRNPAFNRRAWGPSRTRPDASGHGVVYQFRVKAATGLLVAWLWDAVTRSAWS